MALGRGFGYGGNDGGSGGGQSYTQPIVIDSGRSNGSCGCGCQPCATVTDLAAGFNNAAVLGNLNDLQLGLANGFAGVNNAICNLGYTIQGGFHGVDNAVCNLGYHVQDGFNGIQHSIDKCCCDTQRAIDGINYNIATSNCALQNTIQNTTRDVIDNANANSRAILDFLVKDKIDTLQNENLALRFAASQSQQNALFAANQDAQTAELIRRLRQPEPVPSYLVPNPNCCYQPVNFNNGCGCNTGCSY